MIQIKVVNTSEHALPEHQTSASAGVDLHANLSEAILLQPMERQLIPTGLFMELPLGYEAQIRPRSGLAFKHGITVLNTPGTIDADYRGEIKVLLINLGQEAFSIENGERIAQMIIAAHEQISWELTETLSDSERSAGGFGSTGKN